MGDWIDRSAVRARLEREAGVVGKKLGHNLVGWLEQDAGRVLRTRCTQCYEAAVIHVRQFSAAPFGGAALSLYCAGKLPKGGQ